MNRLVLAVVLALPATGCLPGVNLTADGERACGPDGTVLGNVTIDDDTILDQLGEVPAIYGGCRRIDGLLKIDTNNVESLGGFAALEEVGDLVISHTGLTTLEGLENLRRIDNPFCLSIQQNDQLREIDALLGLEACDRFLIQDNPRLSPCPVDEFADAVGLECASTREECGANGCSGSTCFDNADSCTPGSLPAPGSGSGP